MANTIAKQVILNGSRNYVIKVTLVCDGSGELANQLLLNATGDCGTDDKIMKIDANFTGFSGTVKWDATTSVIATQIVGDKDVHLNFWPIGGLVNNAGSGKTGDVVLSTVGFGSGDIGEITLWMKKKA